MHIRVEFFDFLHDAGYTKEISYSSAPLLHKETKDETRNIVRKNDLSILIVLKVTGQSTLSLVMRHLHGYCKSDQCLCIYTL